MKRLFSLLALATLATSCGIPPNPTRAEAAAKAQQAIKATGLVEVIPDYNLWRTGPDAFGVVCYIRFGDSISCVQIKGD